jgi:hypothetical protein
MNRPAFDGQSPDAGDDARRAPGGALVPRPEVALMSDARADIPLFIVLASVGARDGRSFADALIARFDLHGDAAAAVRSSFAAPADSSTFTVRRALRVVVALDGSCSRCSGPAASCWPPPRASAPTSPCRHGRGHRRVHPDEVMTGPEAARSICADRTAATAKKDHRWPAQ